ncbi:Axud1 [Strongyloides ratti]|uniref:Axud1 n=1 Tax=Strongyloides ratti TaxID=34506 RepID=A0A090LDW6_STRRB|nr:Axud1 [Strongyloides ratti]CEF66328.1 Axud1 [Strongyloides ratti]
MMDMDGNSSSQLEIKSIVDDLLADVDRMSLKNVPRKSCLKRRLSNSDDLSNSLFHTPNKSPKIVKHVTFSKLIVYWFERTQGKCSIPTFGGLPLGMCQKDCGVSEFKDFKSFENFMRKHKTRVNRQRWQRFSAAQNELKTSRSRRNMNHSIICNEGGNSDSGVSNIEKRIADDEMRRYTTDTKSFIRMPSNVRKNIFEGLSVEIDEEDEKDTHTIRENRKSVGCDCEDGICSPLTCSCSINGIQCYLDVYGNPTCSCDKEKCRNPEGIIEYKEDVVRCHYDFIKEKEALLKKIEKCFDEDAKQKLSDSLQNLTRDYALKMLQLKQSPIREPSYNLPKRMSFELQISAHDFLFDPDVQYNGDGDSELRQFSKMPSLIVNQS